MALTADPGLLPVSESWVRSLKAPSASSCFSFAGFRVQIFTQLRASLHPQPPHLSSSPKRRPELISVLLRACSAPLLQKLFRLHC